MDEQHKTETGRHQGWREGFILLCEYSNLLKIFKSFNRFVFQWVFGLFVFLLQYLPSKQHVVCVDMPGHEGTSRTGAKDYSIQGQVARIHQVCATDGGATKNHLRLLSF